MLTTKTLKAIGKEPSVAEGLSVVIEDVHGNPIVAVMSLANNSYSIATINDGEKEFHSLLRSMGMDRVVVKTDLQAPKPPKGAERLDPSRLHEVLG